MATIQTTLEQEIVEHIRLLSIEKQEEVLDFATFLLAKVRTPLQHQQNLLAKETNPVDAVERTWGNLSLDRETLIYIAEDKELEYDV